MRRVSETKSSMLETGFRDCPGADVVLHTFSSGTRETKQMDVKFKVSLVYTEF